MSSIRRKINFVVHEELCNSLCSVEDLESPLSDDLTEVFVLEKRKIINEFIEEEKESISGSEANCPRKTSRHSSHVETGTMMTTLTPTETENSNLFFHKEHETEPFISNGSCKTAVNNNHMNGVGTKSHDCKSHGSHAGNGKSHAHEHNTHEHHGHHHHGHENNMRAVFLHILSDLFASLLVILTASAYILMEKYGQKYGGREAVWLMYIDPMLSIVIVIIIVVPTIKLIRESAQILLNNAPGKISPHQFAKELSRHIPEVASVHDLYLWHLTADIIVATTHVVVKTTDRQPGSQLDFERRFMDLSNKLNAFFHGYGITTTTIQVEFADPNGQANECCLKCSGVKEVTGVSNCGRKSSHNSKN